MKSPERKFLHDIATPLSALNITLRSLLDDAREQDNAENLERLERCYKISKQLNEFLVNRREEVQQAEHTS